MRLVLLSLFLVCGDVLLFCLVLDVVRDLCPLSFCMSSSVAQGMSVLPPSLLIRVLMMLLSVSLYAVERYSLYIPHRRWGTSLVHYVTPCKQGHQVVYELRAPAIAPYLHRTIGVTSINDVARHRGQDHVLRKRCLLWRVWF
jgi:hypothetical protein